MHQSINMLALVFGLLLALPLMAQDPLLAEEQGDSTEPGLAMVSVVTDSKLPSDCLAPVAIKSIDGEKRALSTKGFQLDAGIHTLNGLVTLDVSKCRVLEGDIEIPSYAGLEMLFEEGKTYFLAYDRSSPDPRDWKLVVWKEELAPESEVLGLIDGDPSAQPEPLLPETNQ